jgi:hypothetical protein
MISWGFYELSWRKSLTVDHGYHPNQERPTYEYWGYGPIEFRKFSQEGEFLSLELDRVNDTGKCFKCGESITPENDSRWYECTESGWEPICTGCYVSPFRCGDKLTEADLEEKLFILDSDKIEAFCTTCRFTRHHWMKEAGIKTMEKL